VPYYLGIDGGGSKTTCAIGDDSSQLATASAGPSNITRVGESRARESLHKAIGDACAAAKITPEQVQRACIGIAGAGREEVAGVVRKIVAELIVGEINIAGDMPIALEAAFGEGPGVIVIAGTGSIAYGRDEQGRIARAGGWGFAISDEGSAHWIGRTAVSNLLRGLDEERVTEASMFLRGLKEAWGVDSLGGIVRSANLSPDFAALLPAIVAADGGGDEVAKSVLMRAGMELARLSEIVVRRLFPENDSSSFAILLAMAGGVFRYSRRTRDVFCKEIRKSDPRVTVSSEMVEPVLGALRIARRGKAG